MRDVNDSSSNLSSAQVVSADDSETEGGEPIENSDSPQPQPQQDNSAPEATTQTEVSPEPLPEKQPASDLTSPSDQAEESAGSPEPQSLESDNDATSSPVKESAQEESPAKSTDPEGTLSKADNAELSTASGQHVCLNVGSINPFEQQQSTGRWTSGNLGGGYSEDDWFSIRGRMTSLKAGAVNKAVFGFDRMVSGKYALDDARFVSLSNGASLVDFSVTTSGSTGTITVYFAMPENVTSTTLTYQAHIASEFDHGVGMGASSIGGSPYHNYVVSINCRKQGNKELPIKASDLSYALLTVTKKTTPATSLTWPFTLSGSQQASFSLGNGQSTTFRVPPRTWTISETPSHGGWDLAGINCTPIAGARSGDSISVTLAHKASTTCTFSNEQRTFVDLTVVKTAEPSYTHTWDWSINKTVDTDQATGASYPFAYTVIVTPKDQGTTDALVTGKITVTNPNKWPVEGVTVTDSLTGFPGAHCTVPQGAGITVPAQGNATVNYTCTLPEDVAPTDTGSNKASATWSKKNYPGTSGTATSPQVSVDMSTAEVTTIGATASVRDTHYDLTPSELAAGDGVKTFTYTLPITAQAGTCETLDNTATVTPSGLSTKTLNEQHSDSATVTLCNQAPLDVTKNVVGSLERTYGWDISKEAGTPLLDENTNEATIPYRVIVTPENYTDDAWVMTGSVTVRNPNDFTSVTATITDAVSNGGWSSQDPQCVVSGGVDAVFEPGDERTFDYSCQYDAQPSYSGLNTATASWTQGQETLTATGMATFDDDDWGITPFQDHVDITDQLTIGGISSDRETLGNMTWGQGQQTFSYNKTIPVADGTCVTVDNTATLTQTSQQASASMQVCNQADLTVQKNVILDLSRTFGWDITKNIEKITGPDETGAAQIDYAVLVEEVAAQDSSWDIYGYVTVANPNNYTDVTAAITDTIDLPGVTCEVVGGINGGNSVSVPAQGEATLPYLCDTGGEQLTQYNGVNTATATWTHGSDERSATGAAEFTEEDWTINEFSKTVTVHDALVVDASDPQHRELGSITWAEAGTIHPYTYSEQLTVEPGTCSTITNTAQLWSPVEENPQPFGGASYNSMILEEFDARLLGQAQQERTLCHQQQIAASVTGVAQHDRQYTWDIEKIASDDIVLDEDTASGELPYTVIVTEGAPLDSNWVAEGTVTLTNPNNFTAITSDLDIQLPAAVCALDGEASLTVAPGESEQRQYRCTFDQDPGALTVTATATITTHPTQWKQQTQADALAEMPFALAQETNRTITVEDTLVDFEPQWTIDWAQEGTTHQVEYGIDVLVDAGECVIVENTASIVQTEQSADTSTQVCRDEGGVGGVIVEPPTTPPTPATPATPTVPTVPPGVQVVVNRDDSGVLGVRYDLPSTGADLTTVYLAATAFLLGVFLVAASATRRRRRE